ncbi:hypothetical protein G7K_0343-t1 [Saitoella complicata NRRL Y-17804]|uniref:SLC41A/MgtE integral membrane domain-containing protein n=1 Tax=Saitoella complicata (strain BCRC 22490 / CBS 7301 / JCM 7358 / NBRC 10748 / NRRL Y-17804) TaxID=698492 RepID=A0A0E9N8H7_SAICN|nr:hypothetical protein G7K_0343-t1 [Saitoella complicata NRRL Y-17804]
MMSAIARAQGPGAYELQEQDARRLSLESLVSSSDDEGNGSVEDRQSTDSRILDDDPLTFESRRESRVDVSGGDLGAKDNIWKRETAEIVVQSTPSIALALIGSIGAGILLDKIQSWNAFRRIEELFILVPILLNLKGCLELALAARLSTSAHLGELDIRRTRRSITLGNLALLQALSLAIGAIAGLWAFTLGYINKPHRESWFESALMIVTSMVCASLSSVVLNSFMCMLVVLARMWCLDPDNIATPLAASLGDLITTIFLAVVSTALIAVFKTWISTILLVLLLAAIPVFIVFVLRNPYVNDLILQGWIPVLGSMVIASASGVVLERYVVSYSQLPLFLPVLSGLAGNVGCIYASKLTTLLHYSSTHPRLRAMAVPTTLLILSIPIQLVFLCILWGLGLLEVGVTFCLLYLSVNVVVVFVALGLAHGITMVCWRRGWDPDNNALPLLTAIVDVVATASLVGCFTIAKARA